MHLISRPKLMEFWKKHPDSETPLKLWFKRVEKAKWKNFNELKKEFPSADYVKDDRIVFNIKGNNYRIVVLVFFTGQKMFIRFVGTHTEYDKIDVSKV
ncbi:MAG: hypothetical protein JWP12_3939 [Bacteroidetes bacterium]|nr:hypothetical protein [Bacteroidota bacterium]